MSSPAPVICGVDFSPESRRALVCAAGLAERLRCPLHLVSAIEPLLAEAARLRNQLPVFTERIVGDLREFAGILPLPADRVSFEATNGEPVPVLLAAAANAGARMIVVGTRGRGQAARLVLGSTTLRLLRATDRPVLVTDWDDRETAPESEIGGAISRIVCGVDFSEGSRAAVETATSLAADIGATIRLVHAVERAAVPVGWDSLTRDVDADRLADAKARLTELAHQVTLPESLAGRVTANARLGSPAEVLAEETQGDPRAIVAVGLRGASLHRPGSTAIRVVSATQVPVLAVPQ